MSIVDRRPNLIACAGIDLFPTFAEVLVRRRLEKGWSVRRLAEETGIRRQTIYRWEDGTREPTRPHRTALRVALGLTEEDDGGYWGRWE